MHNKELRNAWTQAIGQWTEYVEDAFDQDEPRGMWKTQIPKKNPNPMRTQILDKREETYALSLRYEGAANRKHTVLPRRKRLHSGRLNDPCNFFQSLEWPELWATCQYAGKER
ncbi:unnamed protein product [Nesidiocoris tenuis]|uniref:Uncharacterized protein n=1 Tax=Nesidiocoris tenuis TaxID=355587 RepID=A0A6H5G293_9HEMI|nr:unnamed protein product [Nesidiocoris tenuis]